MNYLWKKKEWQFESRELIKKGWKSWHISLQSMNQQVGAKIQNLNKCGYPESISKDSVKTHCMFLKNIRQQFLVPALTYFAGHRYVCCDIGEKESNIA